MKKLFTLFCILILATLVLSACAGTPKASTPKIPQGENDTWLVKVTNVEEFKDPMGLYCTNCSQMAAQSGLFAASGYAFLDVTAVVVNKTNEDQGVSFVNIGLGLESGLEDCGGMTVEGNTNCLLAAVTRGERKYVNSGLATPDFIKMAPFSPNLPDGETVEFIFLIKEGAKPTDFIFGDLPAIDISKMK